VTNDRIQIRGYDIHLIDLQTRLPFKYGIATMTEVPQAFVRLRVDVNGKVSTGIAADLLPPKWFTKDPSKPLDAEVNDMLRVIQHACATAIGMRGQTAFALWRELYAAQLAWGVAEQVPPLLANFGVSLVERALIEAVCRAAGQPFFQMLRSSRLGVRLDELHGSLQGLAPADFLSAAPLDQVIIRHTVGMADPLTEQEITPGDQLDDHLPQSLEAGIDAYGLRHFKIKISGNRDHDRERLIRIAEVIQKKRAEFAFSLDGNEQFKALADFRGHWQFISAHQPLKEFFEHLLFVEQPLHRDVALGPEVEAGFRAWPDRPPIIIDESDATLESLPAALRLGYAGTSHKNCKGVFKGIANRCLLLQAGQRNALRRTSGGPAGFPLVMSGEDLCNIGPVALLQDLTVLAALGIESVERNGHHYMAGLSQFPDEVQQQMLAAHPDLYRKSAAGWPTLRIDRGQIAVGSVNRQPFGVGFTANVEAFVPSAQWLSSRT
jgi:hypothetical protein